MEEALNRQAVEFDLRWRDRRGDVEPTVVVIGLLKPAFAQQPAFKETS
jgi:hypothetical protein